MAKVYLGIDVSKRKLHLASAERFLKEVTNDRQGIEALIAEAGKINPVMIIVEATGAYETLVVDALHDAGFVVNVAQPGCVRNFAKSLKVLAKTDAIDATVIARFGAGTLPSPTPKTPQNVREFRALTQRRQHIIEDRVREQNRLESCLDAQVRKMIEASISRLVSEEKDLDKLILQVRKADQTMHEKAKAMKEVTGVADKTVNILLGHLPELGSVSRQNVASLAGLAPHPRDSGDWHGHRSIYGGRAVVRRALYMAAMTSARCCPVLSVFYARLRANGKSYKQAVVARARKLIIRLNTIIKELEQNPQSRPQPT